MKKSALSLLLFTLAGVCGAHSAQAAVTLTLAPSAPSVALGGTLTLTATVSGTTNLGLTWSVNGVTNGSSTQGTLTECAAAAPLTCKYTAPSVNVPNPNPVIFKIVSAANTAISKTTTARVTDSIAVTLTPTSKSLALGGTQVFTATLSGTTNSALDWYVNGVSNGSTAQGTLTGCTTVAPRTCKYTAPSVDVPTPNPAVIEVASAADPGKYETANLTVTDPIAVTLTPTSTSLALGKTQVFTATLSGTTNTTLNWYVNGVLNGNAAQGTLSACTTVPPRTCKYTAPSVDVPTSNPAVVKVASAADPGKYKTANLTVTDPIAVTLTPTSTSLALGKTQVFTATLSGTANTALNWYVNGVLNGNAAQGTLSACTTVAPRTCTYMAPPVDVPNPNPLVVKVASAADPGKYKTANLTVTDPVAVTLTPTSTSLALGKTQVFTATLSGTTNTTLNWYVNGVLNGNAAQGTLSACTTVAPRTCTYLAPPVDVPNPNPAVVKVASAADPGKYKTANLTVTDPIAVTLTPTSASLALGKTQVFTATLSGTTNTTLNWYVNGVLNGNSTQGALTGTGLTRTYTAPPVNVPNPNPAVVKVASAADPSKFKTAGVTVTDSIAVTLSPTSASVALGHTQLFTATLSGTTNTALDWYVNGVLNGNSTEGTLTGCTAVAPRTCTYTAPAGALPSPNPAVIEVASVADPTKFKTASVTVTDSIAVTLSPSSASVALGHTQLFTATLSGTTNTALDWYVNGVLNGNATEGTLTGCTAVAPRTCTYTAPAAAVPSPNPAIIEVASAADPTKEKTATVTVTSNLKSGAFSATGSMSTDRVNHTATLLANGRVLVAGGYSLKNDTTLASAEIYNPATGTFSATGSLVTARGQHTATLLANGTVLIAGGFDSGGSPLESAEIYNPTTGAFTSTGDMYDFESTATLLLDGMVLGTGSGGGPDELYNPTTRTFSSAGEPLVSDYLENNMATLLANGNVLVAGGDDGNSGDVFASAEIYNPTTPGYSTTGSMTTKRTISTTTLLTNGKVLVAGGNIPSAYSGPGTTLASAELYNPATGTFSATGSLSAPRQEDTATLLPNGMVLVAGGGAPSTNTILATAELYNPATGTFSPTGSMSIARADFTATLLPDGTVLIVGGNSSPSAELYQP